MRTKPDGPPYSRDEITYELFGIDPAAFYSTKFAHGMGLDNALAHPVFHYEIGYEKFRRLIDDLRTALPGGGTVLDVGCGAAPYGPTLLANVPGIVLHGVDMSQQCLEQARANGYAACQLFDLHNPLPYEDGSLDFVFSMDLLGHIEFRHKDFLLKEIARVTKRGGAGHHGVETGYIDYFNCHPLDESDPIRRYVFVDGHVGVEPAADVCRRFEACFREVRHRQTYLYPFFNIELFRTQFGEEFEKTVLMHDHPQALQLANVLIGRMNTHFLDLYSRVFGPGFTPNDGPHTPIPPEHAPARDKLLRSIERHNQKFGTEFVAVPRELFRSAGFSSIGVKR